jgi:hypothetical protein
MVFSALQPEKEEYQRRIVKAKKNGLGLTRFIISHPLQSVRGSMKNILMRYSVHKEPNTPIEKTLRGVRGMVPRWQADKTGVI